MPEYVHRFLARREHSFIAFSEGAGNTLEPEAAQTLAAQVDAFRALPPESRRQVIGHPFFSFWWMQLITMQRNAPSRLSEWVSHFGQFIVVPCLQAGIWPAGAVTVKASDTGEIRFPGHRRYVSGPWSGGERVAIWAEGELVRLNAGEQSLVVARNQLCDLAQQAAGPIQEITLVHDIELDAGHPWALQAFHAMNDRPPIPPYPNPVLTAVHPPREEVTRQFAGAMDLIAECWPEMHRDVHTYITTIIPFGSNDELLGWSDLTYQGALFLNGRCDRGLLYTAERIVHETGHNRLNVMMQFERLHTHTPVERFSSPIRLDPRPASGIYHAAYTLAACAEFMERAARLTGDEVYRERSKNRAGAFKDTYQTLTNQINLTPFGDRLLGEMNQRVDQALRQSV